VYRVKRVRVVKSDALVR